MRGSDTRNIRKFVENMKSVFFVLKQLQILKLTQQSFSTYPKLPKTDSSGFIELFYFPLHFYPRGGPLLYHAVWLLNPQDSFAQYIDLACLEVAAVDVRLQIRAGVAAELLRTFLVGPDSLWRQIHIFYRFEFEIINFHGISPGVTRF